ncbi:MAG: VOC family protein [Gammaproteobacteria bacterium]|nr:VOC family protein [Gammaproteobacteria bacterium]
MQYQTFVNLPVRDLQASTGFFEPLGFAFDPGFRNDDAAGMVINDGCSYAMLLTHEFFASFVPHKAVADAAAASEVLVALQCDTRDDINDLATKAVNAGGRSYREPQDHGFMYGHGFEDLDGHVWEVLCMNEPPGNTE